jgi:hypothetical protein
VTSTIFEPFLPEGERVTIALEVRHVRQELGRRALEPGPPALLVLTTRRSLRASACAVAGWTIEEELFIDDATSPRVAVAAAAGARKAADLIGGLAVPDGPRQLAQWWCRRVIRHVAPRRSVHFAVVLRRA